MKAALRIRCIAETTMHIAAFDEYIWAHEFVRAIIKAEVFAGNVLYIIIKDGRLVDAYYDKDSD